MGTAFKREYFPLLRKEDDLILGRKFGTLQLPGVTVMISRPSKTWGKVSFCHVCSDKVVASPRVVKRDFRALEQLAKGAGTQAVFSSGLPITGTEIGRKRKSLVLQAEFWFFGAGSVYTTATPAGNRFVQLF